MPASIYEWDEWFKRGRFVLTQGEDYHCSHSSMAGQIRNQACRRNLRIRLTELDGMLVVEVLKNLERV